MERIASTFGTTNTALTPIALGAMIWAQWPVSAFWVLGLFFGIDLILAGWTMVSIALAARQVPAYPAPRPPAAA